MKRSFVVQPDDYSCGPIAIYNALIALGNPPNSMRWIHAGCDPHPDYGTLHETFNKTLEEHLPNDVTCKYLRYPSYHQVSDHVKSGGVVIVCEHWERTTLDTGEHYYTVIGIEDGDYLVANHNPNGKKSPSHKNVTIIKPRELKTSLIRHKLDEYPPNCRHKTAEDDLIYPTVWLLSCSQHTHTRKRKHAEITNDDDVCRVC